MGCVCSRRRAVDLSKASHHRLYNSSEADDISLGSQYSNASDAPLARPAGESGAGEPPTNTVELKRSDSLENLLTCLICLDIIFEPVTADCGHSFCKACLKRLLEYEGTATPCPKCRQPLNLQPDNLQINRRLKRTARALAPAEAQADRARLIEQEDAEYREARAFREENERLMEENPLQLMFDNENDPARRAVLERDVNTMLAMGFNTVQAQKALFLWAGVYHEAVTWLVNMQHSPDIDIPWNMTQLQMHTLIRNTRRSLLSTFVPLNVHNCIPGRLRVQVSSLGLSGSEGQLCWCFTTAGMHALGHSEIVILLMREDGEVEPPSDVVRLLTSLFEEVLAGLVLTNLSSVRFSSSVPFLDDPFNTGMLFASFAGQTTTGIPLPPAPFLFGLLMRGEEIEWAQAFPTRLLLLMGYMHPSDPPFPLWSSRFRPTLMTRESLRGLSHLQHGLKLPGTNIVRTVEGTSGVIRVLLPAEAQQAAVQFVDRNRHAKAITIFGEVALGADTFLVYNGSSQAASLSIPGSDGVAVCAPQCVLVEKRRDGGTMEGDVFVMGLCTASMSRVMASLARAESCEIPAARRGANHSLRIEFLPRAVIESGVAHNPNLFPHSLAIAAACVPRSTTTASLPPFVCRQVDLLELHPRINVVGVTIVTPRHQVERSCDPLQLDVYISSLIHAVNGLLAAHLTESHGSPSSIVLHVDLRAPRDVRFRITKDWAESLPHAPAVTMLMWRVALHAINPPALRAPPAVSQTSLPLHSLAPPSGEVTQAASANATAAPSAQPSPSPPRAASAATRTATAAAEAHTQDDGAHAGSSAAVQPTPTPTSPAQIAVPIPQTAPTIALHITFQVLPA